MIQGTELTKEEKRTILKDKLNKLEEIIQTQEKKGEFFISSIKLINKPFELLKNAISATQAALDDPKIDYEYLENLAVCLKFIVSPTDITKDITQADSPEEAAITIMIALSNYVLLTSRVRKVENVETYSTLDTEMTSYYKILYAVPDIAQLLDIFGNKLQEMSFLTRLIKVGEKLINDQEHKDDLVLYDFLFRMTPIYVYGDHKEQLQKINKALNRDVTTSLNLVSDRKKAESIYSTVETIRDMVKDTDEQEATKYVLFWTILVDCNNCLFQKEPEELKISLTAMEEKYAKEIPVFGKIYVYPIIHAIFGPIIRLFCPNAELIYAVLNFTKLYLTTLKSQKPMPLPKTVEVTNIEGKKDQEKITYPEKFYDQILSKPDQKERVYLRSKLGEFPNLIDQSDKNKHELSKVINLIKDIISAKPKIEVEYLENLLLFLKYFSNPPTNDIVSHLFPKDSSSGIYAVGLLEYIKLAKYFYSDAKDFVKLNSAIESMLGKYLKAKGGGYVKISNVIKSSECYEKILNEGAVGEDAMIMASLADINKVSINIDRRDCLIQLLEINKKLKEVEDTMQEIDYKDIPRDISLKYSALVDSKNKMIEELKMTEMIDSRIKADLTILLDKEHGRDNKGKGLTSTPTPTGSVKISSSYSLNSDFHEIERGTSNLLTKIIKSLLWIKKN